MSWKLIKDKYHDGTSGKITSKTGSLHSSIIKLKDIEKKLTHENCNNNNMKLYPELYKSNTSIYPNYTDLNCLPYYVICRHRVYKTKKQMARQFNREILHMAMMQSHAIASVRIDRNFSIGFPKEAINLPDFATNDERRRINKLMSNR